jgi:hypothetical protein
MKKMALATTRKRKKPVKRITKRRGKSDALQVAINVDPELATEYFDWIEAGRERAKKRTRTVACLPGKMVADLIIAMNILQGKSSFLSDKKLHRYQTMLDNRTCPIRKRKRR